MNPITVYLELASLYLCLKKYKLRRGNYIPINYATARPDRISFFPVISQNPFPVGAYVISSKSVSTKFLTIQILNDGSLMQTF